MCMEGIRKAPTGTTNYIVNRLPVNDFTTTMEECTGGWNWNKLDNINYRVAGKEMEIAIPKKTLHINTKKFVIDFKWADNSPADGDAMHWLGKGDAAPNARFTYRFIQQ